MDFISWFHSVQKDSMSWWKSARGCGKYKCCTSSNVTDCLLFYRNAGSRRTLFPFPVCNSRWVELSLVHPRQEHRLMFSRKFAWRQWKGAHRADVITSSDNADFFFFCFVFLDVTYLFFQAVTPGSPLRLLCEVIRLLFNSQSWCS